MKRFSFIGLIVLLAAASSVSVFAWELNMQGDAEWRYRYWSRTGDVDIFGPMSGNAVYLGINHLKTFPTTGIQNQLSSTFGVLAGENCYGKEMSFVDYRMTLYPKIQVNKAIALEMSVNLTSLGIWSGGQPYNSASVTVPTVPPTVVTNAAPGFVNSLYVPIGEEQAGVRIPNTFVTLQYLKLALTTPMLNFSIGYKATAWGLGLWKHAWTRPSTSFDISAPYGPLTFGFAPYFARSQSSWSLNGSTSRNEGANSYQRQEQRRNYFLAYEFYVIYRGANLETGVVSDSYTQQHANRVNARLGPLTPNTAPDQDDVRYRVDTYMKYTNGRFFLDAEFAWFTRWRGGRGTAGGNTATSLVLTDQDANGLLYAVDMGAISGPSKLWFNYVRATGQDPASRFVQEDAGQAEQGASSCYMQDWGLLMYYMYGTGTGWDAAGYGQPTDFNHLGGRYEYAVAANLNLFGLFSYAWRDQPTGYTLGGDYKGAARLFTNNDIAMAQGISGGYFGQKAVPDSARDIGWEVNVGFGWKLLENLVWKATFAYWKPGTWWSYAYPNTAAIYAFNNGTVPTAGAAGGDQTRALFGLGRDIDPLFGVESNILVQF